MKNGGADLAGRLRRILPGSGIARRACIPAAQTYLTPARRRWPASGARRRPPQRSPAPRTQVIGHDVRRRIAVGRGDLHMAARGGPQIADAGRKRGNVVQRFAEFVERQGLHVHCRFGVACCGSDLANAPSCDGAIDMGPLWNSAYCKPICILPTILLAITFKVLTPCTLNTMRSCRWSYPSAAAGGIDHGHDAMLPQQSARRPGRCRTIAAIAASRWHPRHQQGFPPGVACHCVRRRRINHDAGAARPRFPSFPATDVPRGNPSL